MLCTRPGAWGHRRARPRRRSARRVHLASGAPRRRRPRRRWWRIRAGHDRGRSVEPVADGQPSYVTPRLDRWRVRTDGPLIVLAIGTLPFLLLEIKRDELQPVDRWLIDAVNVVVLVASAVDYLVELTLASDGRAYVRHATRTTRSALSSPTGRANRRPRLGAQRVSATSITSSEAPTWCCSPGCERTTAPSGAWARRPTSVTSETGPSRSLGGCTTAYRQTSSLRSLQPSHEPETVSEDSPVQRLVHMFSAFRGVSNARPRIIGALQNTCLAGLSPARPESAKPCTGVRFPSSPLVVRRAIFLLRGHSRLS